LGREFFKRGVFQTRSFMMTDRMIARELVAVAGELARMAIRAPSLRNVFGEELIEFAKAYAGLGSAVQDQLDDVLGGRSGDVNPNALDLMIRRLGGACQDLDEALEEAAQESGLRRGGSRTAARWAVDLVDEVEKAMGNLEMEVMPALDALDERLAAKASRHMDGVRSNLNALRRIMDRADI
jgi:hypothetical protein